MQSSLAAARHHFHCVAISKLDCHNKSFLSDSETNTSKANPGVEPERRAAWVAARQNSFRNSGNGNASLEFLVLLFSYAQFGCASGQDKRTVFCFFLASKRNEGQITFSFVRSTQELS